MSTAYLVMNKQRSEGVIFTDKESAEQAADKEEFGGMFSSLAEHFFESYAEDKGPLEVEEIELPMLTTRQGSQETTDD